MIFSQLYRFFERSFPIIGTNPGIRLKPLYIHSYFLFLFLGLNLNYGMGLGIRTIKPKPRPNPSDLIREKQAEASLTLLVNNHHILPIRDIQKEKIGSLSLGQSYNPEGENTFLRNLNRYAPVQGFEFLCNRDLNQIAHLRDSLESFSTLIISIHPEAELGTVPKIPSGTLEFLHSLHGPQLIWVPFCRPEILNQLESFENILLGGADNIFSEKLSAEIIFGAISPKGKLSRTISDHFKQGDGMSFTPNDKIRTVLPEELGISSLDLSRVDSIALNSIQKKVFPGCVILAMKDGKIFYEKAFGTHTYRDGVPTKVDDVFDLASVTKITSTLLGVMKVYEQGLIQLDSPLSRYLPDTRNTNKSKIILKELLTHQAGLVPFIPFYVDAMKGKDIFQKDSAGIFDWRVAENMYERNNYFQETMWPRILESPIKTPGKYVYSDLSMYFMRAVLEKVSHQDLKSFVTGAFYNPLGLSTTGFNPRSHIPLSRLIPTEDDTVFRKQLLVGDVHDPGAAMQNGVAGHAGLFSDASDLAVLGQMLLNKGEYGGRIYIRPETVQLFNTRPYPKTSRRALGFDKPDLDPSKYTSVPPMASPETFGHTGFTGTCIWIDPRNKFIYVFLSNRVCPDANNNKITDLSIRPKIHAVFYEALAKAHE